MDYSLGAAHHAQREFANETAILSGQRSLEAATNLGPEVDTSRERISAHEILGEVLTLVGRYDEAQEHLNLARSILETSPQLPDQPPQLAEVCRTYGIGVIPYSPLGGGFLTGKYRADGPEVDSQRAKGVQRYFSKRNWQLLDKMEEIGIANGDKSISQVALAWLLTDPLITSPIIGPRTMEQLKDNLGAVNFRLSENEKQILDEASDPEQFDTDS